MRRHTQYNRSKKPAPADHPVDKELVFTGDEINKLVCLAACEKAGVEQGHWMAHATFYVDEATGSICATVDLWHKRDTKPVKVERVQ